MRFCVVFAFVLCAFNLNQVHAQALDPALWQTQATGLKTSSNPDRKTAGLAIIINATATPVVSLQGGVKSSYSRLVGPTEIELGQIMIPGISNYSLISESADWAHNEMTFSNNLKVWISRLSPAVLIQSQNTALRLFSGNLNGTYWGTSPWGGTAPYLFNRSPAPSYPKYIAYSSGGNVQVRAIPVSSSNALNLPVLDNNWILVWYGNNSHFSETKTPIYASSDTNTRSVMFSDGYQADAPILLKFENNPISIVQSSLGGIDLTFASNSGYTSLLPLYGRDHLNALDTEGWGASGILPQTTIDKINFWAQRFCSYPITVTETYNYDPGIDKASITEKITYLAVYLGGSIDSGFAILPPAVSLVKDALGVNFALDKTLVTPSGGYATEYGPIVGVDNTNTYAWFVSGLKKYTDSARIIDDTNIGNVPGDLLSRLISQVDKITQDGHYLPWIFADRMANADQFGDILFFNPADVIYPLTEIVPVLPEPQKNNLINYIKSERNTYSPETVYNLPLVGSGKLRAPFALDPQSPSSQPQYTVAQKWVNDRQDVFLKKVPLYNLFSLSRYYAVTGEAVPAALLAQITTVLNNNMSEQDWASFSWFKGFADRHASVVNANRHFAGMIGFVKLSKAAGDSNSESLGRALLAKAAVERLAMAKYPRYLYSVGLTTLPLDPAWMPAYTASISWRGLIWNYNWAGPFDDPLQVVTLDQFGTYLYDSTGYIRPIIWSTSDWYECVNSQLSAYKDMVPEVFRFLIDYARQDMEIYLNKVTTLLPHWYMAYSEAILGQEHNVNRPGDSYQLFLAKEFIQNAPAQVLKRYASFPWLDSGDFFYTHKLAETIKTYQGWKWEDEVTGPGFRGDVNNDTQINVLDIQACVNHILRIQDLGSRADVNGDGSVDVLDVQNIVNIILGV